MKKMFIILALVAVACAPAMAAVTITCTRPTSTSVTVGYTVTGPNSVRAFALDATVSTGTISSVTCSGTAAGYYIYPGSIQINSGSVSDYGTCVCSSTYPGTKGGIGTSGVTIEMGSLYTGTSKPATSGTLFTMTFSNSAATVTLAANTVRGGVVMENPAENPSLTINTCPAGGIVECFPSTYTSYSDWKTLGKPDCWCGTNTVGMTANPPVQWKYQCDGDADNKTQTAGQSYRVYTNDYAILLSNWKKKITDPTLNPCADFDHKSQTAGQSYRVYTNDYGILLSNWKKKDTQLPGNCPRGI